MDNAAEIPNPAFEPGNKDSIVKPAMLSHGTLECYSLTASRRFYEEFLGLECVRQGKPAMFIRCGMKFHIVAMQAGKSLKPSNLHQHWGLEVASRDEVDRIYRSALEVKDAYAIGKIFEPVYAHGVYSFYLEDLDHNWWEILFYDGFQHDDAFDFGDRFPMEDNAPVDDASGPREAAPG